MPQQFRGRMATGYHRAGVVELVVEVPPFPAAVLLRRRIQGPRGRIAVLELEGRRGGRHGRPIAFPPLRRAGPLGLLPCLDLPELLFLQLDIRGGFRPRECIGDLARVLRDPPLPYDRRDGDQARHHQGAERRRRHRVPPTPSGQATDRPRPACPDRLVVEEPGQVRRQFGRRRVPPPGLLLQALQADRLQVPRDLGVEPRGRHGLLCDHLPLRLGRGLSAKRRPARQQLVQDRPQRIHVRGRPDRVHLAPGLLGGHVAGRPQRYPADSQSRPALPHPRQAEVGDLGRAVGGQEDVGWLEVAVDDPGLVGRLHRRGQGGQELGGLAGRQGAPESCWARLPPSRSSMVK